MIDFHTARLLTSWFIHVPLSDIAEVGLAGADGFITTCTSTNRPKINCDYYVDGKRAKAYYFWPDAPELVGLDIHFRSSMMTVRDDGGTEEGFRVFRAIFSKESTESLMERYADTLRRGVFNIEGGNPDLTDRELRKCLIWCIYYMKDIWDYKPSRFYRFRRKLFWTRVRITNKVLDFLLKPIWRFL
ncbi:hypothetical protein Uis1B_1162 [Bifidobacterium margollesii]|uniref:Uncharacterized protein n=1 Tax=Bifidobacterium margollesii TaxID=2020964 RepID=A0A2N5J9I5_9BIFI|nr:hypothetical protein [Bifidobacterium margollesii]PLS30873.1 hypothetical protein Uis1B_1162 [Bifidobacterium margollesii]